MQCSWPGHNMQQQIYLVFTMSFIPQWLIPGDRVLQRLQRSNSSLHSYFPVYYSLSMGGQHAHGGLAALHYILLRFNGRHRDLDLVVEPGATDLQGLHSPTSEMRHYIVACCTHPYVMRGSTASGPIPNQFNTWQNT